MLATSLGEVVHVRASVASDMGLSEPESLIKDTRQRKAFFLVS
jgi:hypothetical protein